MQSFYCMYMDTQEIEIDTQKVINEAVERWINLCFLQIKAKTQKAEDEQKYGDENQ